MQARRAFGFQSGAQRGADGGVAGQAIGDTAQQHLQVQARTTHKQRPRTTRRHLGQHDLEVAQEARHIVRLARVDEVQHVVAHRGAFGCRGFGRAHIHAAVHLHGVERHQLVAVPQRQSQGERALAYSCGPDHGAQFMPLQWVGFGERGHALTG